MLTFILKRLALAVPTAFAVILIVFFTARLAPSSPIDVMLGAKANPATRARLMHEYSLDQPIWQQFVGYVEGIVLHGDFGRSFSRGQEPVSQMIRHDFPITAQLAVAALLIAVAAGIPAGILAAVWHDSLFDRVAMASVVAMVSVPSIVLGPVLVLAIAVNQHWLPVSGWEPEQVLLLGGRFRFTIVDPRYLILPAVTLSARSAAILARFMRASLLDVLDQDYIRAARARGLSKAGVVWRHGLKNAMLPVLTVLGTNLGYLLTGSFVVETIFQVPGIGFESINSIERRDYPVIQAMSLLVAVGFILVNLVVDILYAVVDPRVQLQEEP